MRSRSLLLTCLAIANGLDCDDQALEHGLRTHGFDVSLENMDAARVACHQVLESRMLKGLEPDSIRRSESTDFEVLEHNLEESFTKFLPSEEAMIIYAGQLEHGTMDQGSWQPAAERPEITSNSEDSAEMRMYREGADSLAGIADLLRLAEGANDSSAGDNKPQQIETDSVEEELNKRSHKREHSGVDLSQVDGLFVELADPSDSEVDPKWESQYSATIFDNLEVAEPDVLAETYTIENTAPMPPRTRFEELLLEYPELLMYTQPARTIYKQTVFKPTQIKTRSSESAKKSSSTKWSRSAIRHNIVEKPIF